MRVVERRRSHRAREVPRAADAAPADALVDIELVAPVAAGDVVLVHAGVALARARKGAAAHEVRRRVPRPAARPRAGRARSSPRSSPAATTRSWRSAAGTRTRSTSTASTTCCPPNVELVHGPGCPVCVIPMGRVDDGIAIANEPGVIFTCFGDMLRVPGAHGTMLDAKAAGADIRVVYSPLDALRIARENPDREVVFFAIGFETTAPSTALTLKRARAEQLPNFSVMCNHVTIVPPLRALLESPDLRLDGFIGPGHVSHGRRLPAAGVHPGRLRKAGRRVRASSRSTCCSRC